MAVATETLTETQRGTLQAFCDTIVPAIESGGNETTAR